jgi:NO-binding membrane sensor protein with MHYT domain
LAIAFRIAFELGAAAACFALCLIAFCCAFEILAGRCAGLGRARALAPGLLVGALVWAGPLLVPTFSNGAPFDPVAVVVSLAVAAAGSIWAFVAFRRCKGALRLIAPGAIVGAAAAASHIAMLPTLVGADGGEFDSTPFCAGLGVSSGLAVLAFAIFAHRRRGWGRRLAAATLMLAVGASQGLTRASLGYPLSQGLRLGRDPTAPIVAGIVIIALLVTLRQLEGRAPSTPATMAAAWRGSSRLSPRRRPAGTGWLRPQPARSAAGPAAALGRRAQPAD